LTDKKILKAVDKSIEICMAEFVAQNGLKWSKIRIDWTLN